MTLSSLVTALAVGLVIGLGSRWIVPLVRGVPFWVPLAVAISTAMLGTVIARLAGVDTSGVSPVEVVMQVAFASSGVVAVAATTERREQDRRHDGLGGSP
jgi:hypothetical protein